MEDGKRTPGLFPICFIAALAFAILVADIYVLIQGAYVETIGNFLAGIMSWFYPGYKTGYGLVYGKVICYGYICMAPLCLLYAHWRVHTDGAPRTKLRKILLTLYIVLTVVLAALFYWQAGVALWHMPEPDMGGPFYFLFGFIPIISSFMSFMVRLAYIWIFYLLPVLPCILFFLAYGIMKKLEFSHMQGGIFATVLFTYLGCIVIAAFTLILLVTGSLAYVIIWGIRGFFRVDPGSVVHTSDGTSMHQVDGDLYADNDGNYYTFNGDTFDPK